MSSRVVRSRFAIASRYARKRSASAGGPLRTGSLAASCASATDKSTQLRVASETSFLMGPPPPDKLGSDRGHSSDLAPPAVAVHTAWTAPGSSKPAPSREPAAARSRTDLFAQLLAR